ncbi:MAG: reverse transcriptase family protein [Oscillospiraceae bacterium]|jgi:retron-type reverse transcriptase|nr:reverse transcriptase family protein [Oscillospiraceae bacterium]
MEQQEYITRLRQAMEKKQYPAQYIQLCCTYAQTLINKNLPVFFDAQHINSVLRLGDIQEDYYNRFIVKKGKKHRLITAPSKPLKLRQRWILDNILSKIEISEYAHGFAKNRSIVTNAVTHISQPVAFCFDIKDFFPSIKEKSVADIFKNAGYSDSVSAKFASLCCYEGVVPQGAPTSPYIANVVCVTMDEELAAMSQQLGARYTRYADDITISCDRDITPHMRDIENIINAYGFQLNADKTRVFGENRPKFITGLVVGEDIRIRKAFKRKLKQEIHFCKKFGVTVHLENSNNAKSINYKEHLYGKAYYVKMVEPELGIHFLKELDEIVWPI